MNKKQPSPLRFNFGFILEADLGTSREVELDYPSVQLEDDVTLSPLKGTFQVVRSSKGLYLTGELNSTLETECARCLDRIHLPITFRLDDLFYYPANTALPGEFGVGGDGYIDLSPLVRQLSLLEIPMQPFCRPDCKGLCTECGQNLNIDVCDCVTESIDPRLVKLQSLLESQSNSGS